jgi:TRAP-type C4-dicarboxylate transport system substrate-binding protein
VFVFSVSSQFHPVSRRLLVCSALLLSLFSGDLAAHGVTLKYRDAEAANSAFSAIFLQPWAEKIHDDSRGRINLLITAQDAAIPDPNLFQLVLERGVDVVWLDLQGPASSAPTLHGVRNGARGQQFLRVEPRLVVLDRHERPRVSRIQ